MQDIQSHHHIGVILLFGVLDDGQGKSA